MGMEELPSESKHWTSPAFHRICEFCYIKSKTFPEKSPPIEFARPAGWCFSIHWGISRHKVIEIVSAFGNPAM